MMPKLLYHGSTYKQDELMPGFMHTGELIQWDKTESNKYLYATSERETAIALGFASAVDKKYRMDRFSSDNNTFSFIIDENKLPSKSELEKLDVYLYEIEFDKGSGWIKNHNQHNGLTTEYKTNEVIKPELINRCIKINLSGWLKGKEILVTSPRPSYLEW
jgi:hypothetical protein